MVKVEIVKDSHDVVTSFRLEGHTEYDDYGKDIVCAGVSALVQTALVGLLNYLEQKPIYEREAGFLSCYLAEGLNDEDAFKVQIILGTMEMGLREIEYKYKDFIELKIRRC
ncbi:MAG: ribosomal-processing cysteine protease Prp [Syntrophomonadaceae bacterium]|nr:ribosomal-processing cysteine protease Prp [Syntrophomonadaceae bacterium]